MTLDPIQFDSRRAGSADTDLQPGNVCPAQHDEHCRQLHVGW
jgi:hypothetical protein